MVADYAHYHALSKIDKLRLRFAALLAYFWVPKMNEDRWGAVQERLAKAERKNHANARSDSATEFDRLG